MGDVDYAKMAGKLEVQRDLLLRRVNDLITALAHYDPGHPAKITSEATKRRIEEDKETEDE